MEAKTYTKRTNARRAALAEGVPGDSIEITVHKSDQGVRFGWKNLAGDWARQGPHKAAPGTKALAPPKKTPQEPATALKCQTRNGARRPKPGGLCAQVWEWLDSHPTATVQDAKAAAPQLGWNVGNATCEFYAWRKFNRAASI